MTGRKKRNYSEAETTSNVHAAPPRVCKYVLLKLLRAEHESENIDLQYVALIGYSGACSFGGARLC
ncbi:hypothetical protein BX666DRAFT_1968025 [Dichotomocladium elegans]|nr:hypothetical protein BX666DRAFT_1968025 [Dichotomocladium elegans]